MSNFRLKPIVGKREQAKMPSGPGEVVSNSELIIGLVGAVGADLSPVIYALENHLTLLNYEVEQVHISKQVIPLFKNKKKKCLASERDDFESTSGLMTDGDLARSSNHAVLATGAAALIQAIRKKKQKNTSGVCSRQAVIIKSLKHPAEVTRLRNIYTQGFYLIGVHVDDERQIEYLQAERKITKEKAQQLIDRDKGEPISHGQRVADTFHMSDFFVRLEADHDKLKKSVWRILDILFGHPNITPTFQEYAMFLAFAASLRSADLSRQVGAVVTSGREIIATGANDCPKPGGGLYWPEYDEKTRSIIDCENGRDYTRKNRTNMDERDSIVKEIVEKASTLGGQVLTQSQCDDLSSLLKKSRIKDITEFGRPVHAEMEALISCARNRVSTKGGVLYCTTFPCHNCAKHIVAGGISRVVYIEPYPKSKVAQLNDDSIVIGFSDDGKDEKKVRFEPFVGVGPRRFFDLFSMKLGSGRELIRKRDETNAPEDWTFENACLRTPLSPYSYLRLEQLAAIEFRKAIKENNENQLTNKENNKTKAIATAKRPHQNNGSRVSTSSGSSISRS